MCWIFYASTGTIACMKAIIQIDNPVLRDVSASIPLPEISGYKIQALIEDVKEALDSQSDGVGISAVQIEQPVRLFMLSHKAYEAEKKTAPSQYRIFINPMITKTSKDTQIFEEGCLSIRGVYGDVERPFAVTIQAYNEHGQLFIEQANGFVAQVIQHEMDHLDGVLFIDKATNIHERNTHHVAAE